VNDVPRTEFRKAIKANFGCTAKFWGTEHVREEFNGRLVWDGEVHTFELTPREPAPVCYAFVLNGRITTVLYSEPNVLNPTLAVRAAIAAHHKSQA